MERPADFAQANVGKKGRRVGTASGAIRIGSEEAEETDSSRSGRRSGGKRIANTETETETGGKRASRQ